MRRRKTQREGRSSPGRLATWSRASLPLPTASQTRSPRTKRSMRFSAQRTSSPPTLPPSHPQSLPPRRSSSGMTKVRPGKGQWPTRARLTNSHCWWIVVLQVHCGGAGLQGDQTAVHCHGSEQLPVQTKQQTLPVWRRKKNLLARLSQTPHLPL